MDGSQGDLRAVPLGAAEVRRFLSDNPEFLRGDMGLLAELGLRVDGGNIVEFGPAALARVHAAHQREAEMRERLEDTARANFAAQAQTHGAVVDVLDAKGHADLAARVDELARTRFGLAAGVIAVETEGAAPAGWRRLVEGQVDLLLEGAHRQARMGFAPTALPLFGARQDEVRSMAMVRLAIWEPASAALIAFGAREPAGFTPDMGHELVAFLARVVERTAERWRRP
jgi:uncharacterized protein YigA (DUF484 family)